jgi:hypothetical protein
VRAGSGFDWGSIGPRARSGQHRAVAVGGAMDSSFAARELCVQSAGAVPLARGHVRNFPMESARPRHSTAAATIRGACIRLRRHGLRPRRWTNGSCQQLPCLVSVTWKNALTEWCAVRSHNAVRQVPSSGPIQQRELLDWQVLLPCLGETTRAAARHRTITPPTVARETRIASPVRSPWAGVCVVAPSPAVCQHPKGPDSARGPRDDRMLHVKPEGKALST